MQGTSQGCVKKIRPQFREPIKGVPKNTPGPEMVVLLTGAGVLPGAYHPAFFTVNDDAQT